MPPESDWKPPTSKAIKSIKLCVDNIVRQVSAMDTSIGTAHPMAVFAMVLKQSMDQKMDFSSSVTIEGAQVIDLLSESTTGTASTKDPLLIYVLKRSVRAAEKLIDHFLALNTISARQAIFAPQPSTIMVAVQYHFETAPDLIRKLLKIYSDFKVRITAEELEKIRELDFANLDIPIAQQSELCQLKMDMLKHNINIDMGPSTSKFYPMLAAANIAYVAYNIKNEIEKFVCALHEVNEILRQVIEPLSGAAMQDLEYRLSCLKECEKNLSSVKSLLHHSSDSVQELVMDDLLFLIAKKDKLFKEFIALMSEKSKYFCSSATAALQHPTPS